MNDFSEDTIKALATRGIRILSTTVIPGDGPMPFANGSRGYNVDDNDCGKVWTYAQVLEASTRSLCPFDGPHNIGLDEPCPVCGDLSSDLDEEGRMVSNCVDPVI